VGETEQRPKYVLYRVITDVPERTTEEDVFEKWWNGRAIIPSHEISAESECPDDVKARLFDTDITRMHWSRL
jgi:hypothetical protein